MTQNKLPKDWKWVKLNEISDKVSLNKIKIKQKQYLPEGKYPVIDQGQDLIGGYFNDEKLIVPNEPPYIIFGDHTKIKKFINFKFIPGADGVKVLKPKEIIEPKFLFYSLFPIKISIKFLIGAKTPYLTYSFSSFIIFHYNFPIVIFRSSYTYI